MQIKDAVALVTGGNRGLGRAFVDQLLEKGASKVYATSRTAVEFDDAAKYARSLASGPVENLHF